MSYPATRLGSAKGYSRSAKALAQQWSYPHVRSGMPSMSTLGTTHLTPAAIDHAPIYVDREATERMLGMLTVEQVVRVLHRPHVGPAEVGCALGRVLAHELGHVILSARGHERRDLMRPSF